MQELVTLEVQSRVRLTVIFFSEASQSSTGGCAVCKQRVYPHLEASPPECCVLSELLTPSFHQAAGSPKAIIVFQVLPSLQRPPETHHRETCVAQFDDAVVWIQMFPKSSCTVFTVGA